MQDYQTEYQFRQGLVTLSCSGVTACLAPPATPWLILLKITLSFIYDHLCVNHFSCDYLIHLQLSCLPSALSTHLSNYKGDGKKQLIIQSEL